MFSFFLFLCLSFIIGGGLTFIGLISESHRKLIKTGLVVCLLSLTIIVVLSLFNEIINSSNHTPSQNKLTGEYKISEVTNLEIDKASFHKYKLILKRDSTFTLTPTPFIEVCDSGRYEVDYSYAYNELSYRCGLGYTTSHIEKKFGGFRIQFIIGDPDSGESIYFEKVKP